MAEQLILKGTLEGHVSFHFRQFLADAVAAVCCHVVAADVALVGRRLRRERDGRKLKRAIATTTTTTTGWVTIRWDTHGSKSRQQKRFLDHIEMCGWDSKNEELGN